MTFTRSAWTRPLWMRLAAISGGASVLVLILGGPGVKLAAQVQFMHAMATFACATFMNIGGRPARFAPAFFLSGSLGFSGAAYAMALGGPSWLCAGRLLGPLLLGCGWLILAWAAGSVDRR